MFSGEFAQIGFILFLAFLLFGPKKLPEIARTLGKGLGEIRRASNELRASFEEEITNLDRHESGHLSPREELGEIRRASNELKASFEEEISNLERPEPSDPAPKYGYDDSEPASEEVKPRT